MVLTWTITSLPLSRTRSNVFWQCMASSVKHAPAQTHLGDQGLDRRDLVGLLVDDGVGEDDLMADPKGAENMRCLAVSELIKALPQGLTVNGNEPGRRVPQE